MDAVDKILHKFAKLGEILESGTVSEKSVSNFLNEIYSDLVGDFKPVIKALPDLGEKVGGDLGNIFAFLIKAANSTHKNKEVEAALDEYIRLKAERKFKALKAYQKAGFRRNEALVLMLDDNVAVKQALSGIKLSARS